MVLNPKYSLENRIAYRFSVMSTMNLRAIAGVYTKRFGLSAPGWRILSIIGRYEPIFPGIAAQRSTMDPDKVTRAVDRLVEMGYVIRNTDAADRRRVILCLSSRGRLVYEQIEELSQSVDARWRSVLTDDESAAFDAIMGKLESRAEEVFSTDLEQLAGTPAGTAAVRSPTKKRAKTPAAAAKRA